MIRICLTGCLVLSSAMLLVASDLDDATKLYQSGKYEEAEALAAAQVERGIWNERWPRLLIHLQLTRGKYTEAKQVYEDAIRRYPTSLTLRMLGMEVLNYSNLPEEASEVKYQILQLLQASPTRYSSRDNLVAAGRYFAMRGEDGRKILEMFYDRVIDADPQHTEAHLATAELALDKGDFKVAAETLQKALRFDNEDPRIHYLLARAWEPSDGEKASAAIEKSLEINPNHQPSLIFQAEAAIDREQYQAAELLIRKILEINPRNQEAFALMAVLANLRGKYDIETKMRETALSSWGSNPRIDYLIGKKLSQKYRFEEGVKYQQKALEIDPSFPPASFQLAQDLLRLGSSEVGWQLAKDVADGDPYNVVAHNLMTLYDRTKDFRILETDGIQLRMENRESLIYGQEVLDLLSEAKQVLCKKYDVEPRAPIIVEIFPQQKDFAIRTFGLPGGDGFLGVCFGRVITANSPASQGENPANWQSVLWHEFCHVVTLEKTKNRMPRWLSEGISVYEERKRNPAWGESITPLYREMMLGDELTPVSGLSGAFLTPPTPIHLQFAYFESSLVVEYLIEQYGMDAVLNILDDLADGLGIEDALARHAGTSERLDVEFAEYARRLANEFGPKADWSREGISENPTTEQLAAWVKQNPNSYWGLRQLAAVRIGEGEYAEALPLLETLDELEAFTGERGDPVMMLARCYRELNDTPQEIETLQRMIGMSSDSLPALRRLMELATANEQWDQVATYAEQINAINPLIPEGHTAMATAAEQLEQPEQTLAALKVLNRMDPIDPAEIDFRLAKVLINLDNRRAAKHHVLRALEQAPRYRDAHRLLLTLQADATAETNSTEPTSSATSEPEETSEPGGDTTLNINSEPQNDEEATPATQPSSSEDAEPTSDVGNSQAETTDGSEELGE
ncbi:MAG: tetratricopeptide repeat protein [Planctomycetaceae bacterium]|nr:tetratricopeptide repeat protein [Planctomycetaceae bacterium]